MQNFVRDRSRGTSPQTVEHRPPGLNAKRQASGANAKISLRKGGLHHQYQTKSEIPSRGLSHAQNSSATILPHLSPHQKPIHGQEKKYDAYDTDVESLDTTINFSVAQAGNQQRRDQQYEEHRQRTDLSRVSDEDDGEFDEEIDFDNYEFTAEDVQLFAQAGLQDVDRGKQLAFLQHIQLPLVEGDSYPSTTDGNPTEWEGRLRSPSTDLNHNRIDVNTQDDQPGSDLLNGTFLMKPLQKGQVSGLLRTEQVLQKSSTDHRDQPNLTKHLLSERAALQNTVKVLPTSQLLTYSQANPSAIPSLIAHSPKRLGISEQVDVPIDKPHHQVHAKPLKPWEPPISSEAARPLPAQADATDPRASEAEVLTENFNIFPDGDYDRDALINMSYDQLKGETFDFEPRAGPRVLPNDLLHKRLVERVEFAQKNLDGEKQSDFFCSLPHSEWEEAGDWFLDQFQNIIQRTKEARRKKRGLAQDFEVEVEERYNHVLKKQRQAEKAMNKMKMQGEGLVAKSPRPFKSTKTRRG